MLVQLVFHKLEQSVFSFYPYDFKPITLAFNLFRKPSVYNNMTQTESPHIDHLQNCNDW